MSQKTDALRDLYVDVTGTETVTESQRDEGSRTPIGDSDAALEREVSEIAREDGLDGAIQGTEAEAN